MPGGTYLGCTCTDAYLWNLAGGVDMWRERCDTLSIHQMCEQNTKAGRNIPVYTRMLKKKSHRPNPGCVNLRKTCIHIRALT